MHDIRKVIADTSVLIAFEKLELLHLLCSLYEQILLTSSVYTEYSSEMQSCFIAVKAPLGLSKLLEEKVGLGCGESESIALAYTSGTTILVDDLKARKTAKKLGCRMSGTIGVLHRMQRQGLISSAYEEMSKLKNMGFRVSTTLMDRLKISF